MFQRPFYFIYSRSTITVEVWESDDRFGQIIGRFPVHKFTVENLEDGKWQMNRWNIQDLAQKYCTKNRIFNK